MADISASPGSLRACLFHTCGLGYEGASLRIAEDAMTDRTCLAIVLAAGEGTRMRSAKPKVLHQIGGQSLLSHVLSALRDAGSNAAVVAIRLKDTLFRFILKPLSV